MQMENHLIVRSAGPLGSFPSSMFNFPFQNLYISYDTVVPAQMWPPDPPQHPKIWRNDLKWNAVFHSFPMWTVETKRIKYAPPSRKCHLSWFEIIKTCKSCVSQHWLDHVTRESTYITHIPAGSGAEEPHEKPVAWECPRPQSLSPLFVLTQVINMHVEITIRRVIGLPISG